VTEKGVDKMTAAETRPSAPRDSILYVGSWAERGKPKDTYQAALLFAAATAMAEKYPSVDVKVALLGDAVDLIVDAHAQQMQPVGRPDTLFKMIKAAVDKGVKIHC
jgi:predicted peroxiredoxin